MLRTIIASLLVIIALAYFGCNNENSNITSPEKSISKMTVPFKANGYGNVYAAEYCVGNPQGRRGESSGNATHLGNYTSTFKYCVLYQSMTFPQYGLVVNPTEQVSVFKAANGDELNMVITGGSFAVVGFEDINGVNYIKVSASGTGNFIGGTGRFENATGVVTDFSSIQYIDPSQPAVPAFGSMVLNGTLSY